jgi:glutathione S-transferase
MVPMKLYDNALSPYALKVRMALYEKGLPFDLHEIHTHEQREELLRVNPRGEVPALEDAGCVITDSPIICMHLERTYPTIALYPSEPAALNDCLQIQRFSDTQLDAATTTLLAIELFRPQLHEIFPKLRSELTQLLDGLDAHLETLLAGREFLAGSFSIADIAVLPHLVLARSARRSVDQKAFPRLASWFVRMRTRESVKRALQDMAATYSRSQTEREPLFDSKSLHWRSDRIECLVRLGLGPWLHEELQTGRAFLSPPL